MQEGPLRPVLECIDLLSDSEDEGCSSLPVTVSFFFFFNRSFGYLILLIDMLISFFS